MGWLFSTILLLSSGASASGDSVVPSRDLVLPLVSGQNIDPFSFYLLYVRDEMHENPKAARDGDPHSIFVIKRHVGASAGYDNTVVHGSVGLYLTVAEWGRWNFGVPSVA